MSFSPAIPENAPFSPEQRAWLNGFFAGMFSRQAAGAEAQPAALPPSQPLAILWGSQTGTSEGLAKQTAKLAGKGSFAPTIYDMGGVGLSDLLAMEHVLIITSTYGEGDPPDNATALLHALRAAPPGALPASLKYSVCSLGDTNYEKFCQCGIDFDAALARLGATRVCPRVDCDVDYDEPFAAWQTAALNALSSAAGAQPVEVVTIAEPATTAEPITFGKKNPFPAPLLKVSNLNAPGSAKEVNHVEFSLEGSGLAYEAGDALAVIPENDPALVALTIATLGCDGEESVTTPTGDTSLRLALTQHFDLGKPSKGLLSAFGLSAAPELPHVIDVIKASGTQDYALVVSNLRKLAPRLYSISSSPKAHPGQVHLTVGAVRYEQYGLARKGVCSTFLAERALAVGRVGVFVHSNKAFRPPADPTVPAIMVGPGTGIAPFRAFLEERAATQAPGRNWLFFGDQHAATDYLYREQLEAWVADGTLARLDVAFSRDQAEKVYVQNRMREAAGELWSWLEAGAHFYVCGDASRMAKDVDLALHDAIVTAGGKTPDEAVAYVQALKSAKRYQRDVY